jgi:SAM-dependent methyltransferase
MSTPEIRFDDAAAYERRIGEWSRLAGGDFLDWLAPRNGLRWIDVGCGSATFTELIVAGHAPAEVKGIDPSDAQLTFARARSGMRIAQFMKGDAMALPFQAAKFDVATMALVIFFVPEPAKGVAEMVRVVAPGGEVAAYAWGRSGFRRCVRRNPRRRKSRRSRSYGRTPASLMSKREGSTFGANLRISMTSGRHRRWERRLFRFLRRCRRMM